jgi:hypothetical protein
MNYVMKMEFPLQEIPRMVYPFVFLISSKLCSTCKETWNQSSQSRQNFEEEGGATMWTVVCYHSNTTTRKTSDWQNAIWTDSTRMEPVTCHLFRQDKPSTRNVIG